MAHIAVVDNATNAVLNTIIADVSDPCPDGCRFEIVSETSPVRIGDILPPVVLAPEPETIEAQGI